MNTDRVPLFDLDPELAEPVPTDQLAAARAVALVTVHDLATGGWAPDSTTIPAARFLVLHGCLTREISILGEPMAVDFVPHGDVLHPFAEPAMTSTPADASWSVLSRHASRRWMPRSWNRCSRGRR